MQEKQIISTTRATEEGLKESPVDEDIICRSKLNKQSNVCENSKAAAYCHRTISEFTHRTHGDSQSGS
jgi:hypothetical protein